MTKTNSPPPRGSRFNRFQTALTGLRYVQTATDAHFDPDREPPRRPQRSLAAMEAVAPIQVEPAAPARS
ncbi:MAG: hypothetical protein ACRD1L_00865 [Terriglobales bacterium]